MALKDLVPCVARANGANAFWVLEALQIAARSAHNCSVLSDFGGFQQLGKIAGGKTSPSIAASKSTRAKLSISTKKSDADS